MNSPKNFALVILALAALGGAVLAWKQHLELQALREAAASVDDRETLKRRAFAAEQRAKDLADELTALRDKQAEAKAEMAKADRAKPAGAPGDGLNMRSMMANAANMMNRPEMQRMMALGQKAALDANYAKLFKQLGLDPDKLEQLKKLMVERSTVGADVFAAAAQQGLDPMQNRRELAKLTAEGQAKVDGEIQSLLGDDAYGTYQNYQTTLPQRSVVNQLQQSLSYTANPLSDTQAEQLVQILAANPIARPAGAASPSSDHVEVSRAYVVAGTSGGSGDAPATKMVASVGPGGPMGLGGAQISDAAVAASRTVLTDAQAQALQDMQQQQAQMRSVMQTMGGGPGQGAGIIQFNSTTTTSSGGNQPPPPAGTKPPGGG